MYVFWNKLGCRLIKSHSCKTCSIKLLMHLHCNLSMLPFIIFSNILSIWPFLFSSFHPSGSKPRENSHKQGRPLWRFRHGQTRNTRLDLGSRHGPNDCRRGHGAHARARGAAPRPSQTVLRGFWSSQHGGGDKEPVSAVPLVSWADHFRRRDAGAGSKVHQRDGLQLH